MNVIANRGATEAFLRAHISHKGDDCLLWPYFRDPKGYGRANASGHATRVAHRIMCAMAHGPAPFQGALARHLCGRGHEGCVNPRHLAWGTRRDNAADMAAHGTKLVGARNAKAVLDSEKVRDIRRKHRAGATQRAIASELGVHPATVQAVINRRTWSHVS